MDRLPDDAIKSIGQYAGILHGGTAYINFAQTCKRMKQLLLPVESNTSLNNQTIKNIISKRVSHHLSNPRAQQQQQHGGNTASSITTCRNPNIYNIHTLQQLSIFESWLNQTNFVHDNRIPFPFASTEIEPDMQRLIDTIANFIFSSSSSGGVNDLVVRLDAHCGTAAPSGIDSWFSRARGLSVRNAVYEKLATIRRGIRCAGMDDDEDDNDSNEDDDDDNDHGHNIKLVAWGKRIASIVEQLADHPYHTLAGEGRGWVEVYFIVPPTIRGEDGENDSVQAMVLPPRHGYYFSKDGRSINSTGMEEGDERLADIIIDFNQQHAHMFE